MFHSEFFRSVSFSGLGFHGIVELLFLHPTHHVAGTIHHPLLLLSPPPLRFNFRTSSAARCRGERTTPQLVTPRDDRTGEDIQVISATDGTPVPIREIIDALSESSRFKPNNLSCLFTGEKCGNATIEIIDAVEFNCGIVLTQHVNHNLTRVFRDGIIKRQSFAWLVGLRLGG